jgi:AcrR family transcriptional regulator
MPIMTFDDLPEPTEVTYAEGRYTTRTYASRSFRMQFGRDDGQPARYVHRVFDEVVTEDNDEWEWTIDVVYTTPGGRKQLELQVAREAGAVRKLRIQKVPTSGDLTKLEPVLELDRDQATRLIDMLKALDSIPIEGESTVHVDDQLLRDVFADPTAMASVYANDPERFRALIESDANGRDVIALQHRREVAATMRQWLEDDEAFAEANSGAGGPEKAWQQLLEANPWVLGIGLGGQLLTSWEEGKLEQTVVGRSIKGVGKRADALLRTAGIVRSLVFAEIKHHQTRLLGEEYRPGSWSPSKDVAGALVQVQQTVHLACRELGDYIQDQASQGELLGRGTFLLQPRSYVIVGSLDQLTGDSGGSIPDKVRSFELFRRNLHQPELITFDELVARAEWHVEAVAHRSAQSRSEPQLSPTDPWGEDEPPF